MRFAEYLDIAPFLTTDNENNNHENSNDNDNNNNNTTTTTTGTIFPSTLYRLQGIVIHSGRLGSGHYTAATRTQRGWQRFSDTSVKGATLDDVLNSEAYLLFYARVTDAK